ncbi:MAG: hypothetical protein J3K34DRAFT_520114 [Monoraphidium minutum]|nr:MAG: hypothetical protein J3K34DRAFT_520114 [Monoraphidium minutum]
MGEFTAKAAGAAPSELSAEPRLWLYKQLIVVLVLGALGVVVAAPLTANGSLLWYLAFFTTINLVNGCGQAARMVSAVLKLRRRVVPRAPGAAPLKPLQKGGDADGEGACLLHVDDVPAWHHVFVIPNYREDLAVLGATLDRLAAHRHASHYTILLAMEEKEAYAEQKAAQLQEQYCLRFKAILFTLHSLDPVNEMPGKASNVNAAVRQFAATVPPADRARYMLTVMDADALVPPAYVNELEATTAGLGSGAADNVYAAPVLFEQNGSAVPSLVRVTDYTWGALAMQNLNNWTGVGFPISNYSLSLGLAAEIGFWDTWPDAIGEDMHTFIKAYSKTGGRARLYPIFAPINMGHVNADGFFASIVARYTQAERHMRGIADTAYAMREVATGSMPLSWRSAALVWGCWEAHLVSTVSLISYMFLPMLYGVLGALGVAYHDHPLQRSIIDGMGRANLVLMITVLVAHEVARAMCRRHLYGLRGPSIPATPHGVVVHVASYLWLFLGVWLYTVLPMVVVIVKHALNIRSTNYIVAEKKATAEACLDPATPPALPISMGALAGGGGGLGGSASSLASLSGSGGGARRVGK